MFLGLLPSVVQPVTSLANLVETLQKSSGSLLRITQLLDEPVTVDDPAEPVLLSAPAGAVELHDVSFTYPGGRSAIDGVSLRLEPGSQTAIVGESGSGKSTLLAPAHALLRSDVRFGHPRRRGLTAVAHR